MRKAPAMNLVGASLEEIEAAVCGMDQPRYRARQIYSGIYRRLLRSWDEFTDLGIQFRENLKQQFTIAYPPVQQVFVSRTARADTFTTPAPDIVSSPFSFRRNGGIRFVFPLRSAAP